MLNIGEFSKLTHVSVRMLRYYDEHDLLKPDHIDKDSGYRMYGAKQVPDLQKIVLLRDLNFPVAKINQLIKNWNKEFLIEELNNKIKETELTVHLEHERMNKMRDAIKDIHKEQMDIHYNVTIKTIPSYHIISLRKKIPTYFHEGELWQELTDFIEVKHIDIERSNYNNLAIYHDEDYVESDVDVEIAYIVKKPYKSRNQFIYRELDSVQNMACMMVYGCYENLAGAYQSFIHWLDSHSQYEMNGLSRQITIIGVTETSNPSDYLTEIQIPIQIKGRSN